MPNDCSRTSASLLDLSGLAQLAPFPLSFRQVFVLKATRTLDRVSDRRSEKTEREPSEMI
jgi:hypothetical protein